MAVKAIHERSLADGWGSVRMADPGPQVSEGIGRVALAVGFPAAEALEEPANGRPRASSHRRIPGSEGRPVLVQAIRHALDLGGGTPREQAYIEALAALFEESDSLDYKRRVQRFAARMEQIYRRYPEDLEAALFYAISLLGTIDPMDASFTVQRRAGEIAQAVFREQPNHPGAAHYVIHAYDYPPLANEALPAARRYAEIAPAAAHALHMPSHIFSRLGLWQESIETNLASKAAAVEAEGWTEAGHTLDYMIYAHLQRAEDTAAARLMGELIALGSEHPDDYGVLEHLADGKARFLIEKQDWSAYKSIDLDPDLSRFPRFEATVRFARALGAARSGHPAAARREVETLAELHARLSAADEDYYAANVAIWQAVAEAWIAYAAGAPEQALQLMQAAADLDDQTAYVGSFESGPDVLIHTREQLGDLLLELGRSDEALRGYEASLADSPNRFNGLFGAGRAAELAGEEEKARTYYGKLVELAQSAEGERNPLRMARSFLEGH